MKSDYLNDYIQNPKNRLFPEEQTEAQLQFRPLGAMKKPVTIDDELLDNFYKRECISCGSPDDLILNAAEESVCYSCETKRVSRLLDANNRARSGNAFKAPSWA